jgi:hypothetical protein
MPPLRAAEAQRELQQSMELKRSMEDIEEAVSKAREKIVGHYEAMTTAVTQFTEARDRDTQSALTNERIQGGLDDDTLRNELLDIDQMTVPDSEKNRLRSEANQRARQRKEERNVAAAQAAAERDQKSAAEADALARGLTQQADALTPSIKEAEASVDAFTENQKRTDKFVAEQQEKNAKRRKTLEGSMGLLDEPLNPLRPLDEASRAGLRKKFQAELDELDQRDKDLEEDKKRAAQDLQDETERRDALRDEQSRLDKEADKAQRESDKFSRRSRDRAFEGSERQRELDAVRPFRDATDARERNQRFERERAGEARSAAGALGRFTNQLNRGEGTFPIPEELNEMSEVNAFLKALGDKIITITGDQAKTLQLIIQRLEQVEQQDRNRRSYPG